MNKHYEHDAGSDCKICGKGHTVQTKRDSACISCIGGKYLADDAQTLAEHVAVNKL